MNNIFVINHVKVGTLHNVVCLKICSFFEALYRSLYIGTEKTFQFSVNILTFTVVIHRSFINYTIIIFYK